MPQDDILYRTLTLNLIQSGRWHIPRFPSVCSR